MNKILKIGMIVAVVLGFTACYNDFDDPAPTKFWTADDFPGTTAISIKDFKDLFYNEYGSGASSLAKTYEVTEDYLISGKVISSDQAGNVYKSVYIYDGTAAIELKLMVSNYVYYHLGQTIFVKAKGLAIGRYRYMLSLGAMPSDADIADGYANTNIDTRPELASHIFIGNLGTLTTADTLFVDASNYSSVLTDNDLGRLVCFQGLTYKEGTFDGDKYPQYLEVTYPDGQTTGVYTNKYYQDENLVPTYAYNYSGDRYYGSSWFGYGTSTSGNGQYIVRVSGYADFADQPLPEAGATGDLTALYTKYSARSGGYIKYQLVLNSYSGVESFYPSTTK